MKFLGRNQIVREKNYAIATYKKMCGWKPFTEAVWRNTEVLIHDLEDKKHCHVTRRTSCNQRPDKLTMHSKILPRLATFQPACPSVFVSLHHENTVWVDSKPSTFCVIGQEMCKFPIKRSITVSDVSKIIRVGPRGIPQLSFHFSSISPRHHGSNR